jgi:hypothetical protein
MRFLSFLGLALVRSSVIIQTPISDTNITIYKEKKVIDAFNPLKAS